MNSPRTLRAPLAPAWPARTEARAVFEVLLATAGLLAEKTCRENGKNKAAQGAEETVHETA
ncbi:hypothetical protein GCM10009835_09370 [Planosporangium flavigriseum]|uniref:Uncharacterized protein n=1 Tax=Planosporangium flavigriseum TaxID=373681 RepID=A0A8J3LLG8_9ACTN|nr:hypothetical protein Pfl04_37720 [Planosporangium flavigriseum]